MRSQSAALSWGCKNKREKNTSKNGKKKKKKKNKKKKTKKKKKKINIMMSREGSACHTLTIDYFNCATRRDCRICAFSLIAILFKA